MRKTLMALPVALALVSCNGQLSEETPAEISFEAVSCVETKGFVKGSDLTEESGTPRDINVSVYNASKGQSIVENATFCKDGTSWKNFQGGVHIPLFWPDGSNLDIMAYSVGTSTPVAAWNTSNPASGLVLDVTDSSIDDDILYASVKNCSKHSSLTGGNIALNFKHAQAWVEFELFSEDSDIYSTGITIDNVYTSGTLSITDNSGLPTASWDLSSSPKVNRRITPGSGSVAVPGLSSAAGVKYSVLLPPQQRCEFKVHFTVGAGTAEHIYTYTLDTDKIWYSGKHYTYKVNVNSHDIAPASPSASRSRRISVSVQEQDF